MKVGDSICLRQPTFAMYDVYSKFFVSNCNQFDYSFNTSSFCFDWDINGCLSYIKRDKPSVIFLANPDSPTGNYLSEKYFELIKAAGGSRVYNLY